MSVAADLHIHTSASDGLLAPQEIVTKASHQGLIAISITDHDTVDGLREGMQAAGNVSLEFIPGIEISTELHDTEIHILGYYIDSTHHGLTQLLEKLQESRARRAEKMVEKLTGLGKKIDIDSVLRIAGRAAPGRPHIARALVEKGYVKSIRQAFTELIGYRGPAYVERFKLSPYEAIKLINEAGGIAAWAHPGLTTDAGFLKGLLQAGLQGIEVYHPEHSWAQTAHFHSLALELGLIITGGSDYHGNGVGPAEKLAACGISNDELCSLKGRKPESGRVR
jgi:3',5'-nucleoside bisphosphate phosphatase